MPAVQVVEHAAAILEDDRACGFERQDPFLASLAKTGPSHSVSKHQKLHFLDILIYCIDV